MKTAKWCQCGKCVKEQDMDFSTFSWKSGCKCGIQKEHIHCVHCGGVSQVG
jgi:hypothetical protein